MDKFTIPQLKFIVSKYNINSKIPLSFITKDKLIELIKEHFKIEIDETNNKVKITRIQTKQDILKEGKQWETKKKSGGNMLYGLGKTLNKYPLPNIKKFVKFYNLHNVIKGITKLNKEQLINEILKHIELDQETNKIVKIKYVPNEFEESYKVIERKQRPKKPTQEEIIEQYKPQIEKLLEYMRKYPERDSNRVLRSKARTEALKFKTKFSYYTNELNVLLTKKKISEDEIKGVIFFIKNELDKTRPRKAVEKPVEEPIEETPSQIYYDFDKIIRQYIQLNRSLNEDSFNDMIKEYENDIKILQNRKLKSPKSIEENNQKISNYKIYLNSFKEKLSDIPENKIKMKKLVTSFQEKYKTNFKEFLNKLEEAGYDISSMSDNSYWSVYNGDRSKEIIDEIYNKVKKGYKKDVILDGGALKVSEIKDFITQSYNKVSDDRIGEWLLDKQLSTTRAKVYHNKKTGQTTITHTGTDSASDWGNNLVYGLLGKRGYKYTKRYKEAKKVQDAVEKKYGTKNLSVLGHSQGGLLAEMLGTNAKEKITLNKATRIGSNVKDANQYDISTTGDVVSKLNPFQKKSDRDIIINKQGLNPLTEHSPDVLKRIDQDKLIGGGDVIQFFKNFNKLPSKAQKALYGRGGKLRGGFVLQPKQLAELRRLNILKRKRENGLYLTEEEEYELLTLIYRYRFIPNAPQPEYSAEDFERLVPRNMPELEPIPGLEYLFQPEQRRRRQLPQRPVQPERRIRQLPPRPEQPEQRRRRQLPQRPVRPIDQYTDYI